MTNHISASLFILVKTQKILVYMFPFPEEQKKMGKRVTGNSASEMFAVSVQRDGHAKRARTPLVTRYTKGALSVIASVT